MIRGHIGCEWCDGTGVSLDQNDDSYLCHCVHYPPTGERFDPVPGDHLFICPACRGTCRRQTEHWLSFPYRFVWLSFVWEIWPKIVAPVRAIGNRWLRCNQCGATGEIAGHIYVANSNLTGALMVREA